MVVGRGLREAVVELDVDGQGLLVVLLGLLPLPLLLRHTPQVMVGRGLREAVVELDVDGQGLLVVLLGLLPLPLLLRHPPQLMVGRGLQLLFSLWFKKGQRVKQGELIRVIRPCKLVVLERKIRMSQAIKNQSKLLCLLQLDILILQVFGLRRPHLSPRRNRRT